MSGKRQKIDSLPDQFRCLEVSVPNCEGERAYALLDHLTGLPIVSITKPESTHTQLRLYFPSSTPLKIRGARGVMKRGGGIRDLSKHFKVAFASPCSVRTYLISDWKEKWKKGLKPRKVTPRLWVCPSWKSVRAREGESVIRLDPGMAFGTGLHPTTQFVLKMIDRYRRQIDSFIDVGTGSGILAIGAALLGVTRIQAIDYDPHSIETAMENFKKNKCTFTVIPSPQQARDLALKIPRRQTPRNDTGRIWLCQAALEKFKTKQKFDFVAANLETRILLRSKKELLRLLAPGGYLTMTGIGNASRREVLKHYESQDLKLIAQFKGREWSGFCFVNRRA